MADREKQADYDFGSMKNPLLYMLEKDAGFRETHTKSAEGGFHIHSVSRPDDKWTSLSDQERQKRHYYFPIASEDEVERIISKDNALDLLLFKRAESVVNNMRILRVFHKRACYVPLEDWRLEDQFDDSTFHEFLENLEGNYKEAAMSCHYGTIFSDEPTAYCELTPYGNMIVLSEAFSMFLYWMNLAFLPVEIPYVVRIDALQIGLRTMFMSESFDFEIDPRAQIPEEIDRQLRIISAFQEQFMIGHEISHVVLGHLTETKRRMIQRTKMLGDEDDMRSMDYYVTSRKQELAADIMAVDIMNSSAKSKDLVNKMIILPVYAFYYLYIFEETQRLLMGKEKSTLINGSHPSAFQRINNLMEAYADDLTDETKQTIDSGEILASEWIDRIKKWYAEKPDLYSFYGAIYIREWYPWKKQEDRVDY